MIKNVEDVVSKNEDVNVGAIVDAAETVVEAVGGLEVCIVEDDA